MNKKIQDMNKKELKDYINDNGFFFHMQCDTLQQEDVTRIMEQNATSMRTTSAKPVEGKDVIYYKGIASQNYGVGEKSRNGYKYDQNGWIFDDYFNNPLVLFQHDQSKPIGNAMSFWLDTEQNLNIMFFVYKDAVPEGEDRFRVDVGLIKAISTGALSEEYMFEENDTGNRITEDEAEEKYGWGNIWDAYYGMSEFLTLVITKAKMIENSLVTIGSNEKAMAMQNAIGGFFQSKAEELKDKLGDKINERKMIKKDNTDTDQEAPQEVETTETEEEIIEAPEATEKTPVETEENKTDEAEPDVCPTCGKEPCECEDGCGKKKKNELETPETTEEPISSEIQDETTPETAEEAPENEAEEVVENKEDSEKSIKKDTSSVEIKTNSQEENLELNKMFKSFTDELNIKFEDKIKELENAYQVKSDEQSKVLTDVLAIVKNVLEQTEKDSLTITNLVNKLKTTIVDGPSVISKDSVSKHPLMGKVSGLERIMGIQI